MGKERYPLRAASRRHHGTRFGGLFLAGALIGPLTTYSRIAFGTLRGAQRAAASPSRPGGRLIVVLDVDECLVHSTDFSDEDDGVYRQAEASRQRQAGGDGAPQSFPVTIKNSNVTCTVLKRPDVDEFLRACAAEFEVYTFTAGIQDYAEPLLDNLDQGRGMLAGRFYRHDCREVLVPAVGFQYLKDLTAVTADLHRCVLVDNNPLSFVCQPRNGIPVPDFVGVPDKVLTRESYEMRGKEGRTSVPPVLEVLRELAGLPDVRPALAAKFGLEANLAGARRRLLGERSDSGFVD